MQLLQTDIDACDAVIRHCAACGVCTEDKLCPAGDELYQGYLLAHSRAKFLLEDTPYVIF
jgi:hypothetical protein